MRIAIYSDNFYPELSGIADSIMTLAKELAGRGHEIAFFVPSYSDASYKLVDLPKKEVDLGERVRVIRLPSVSYPTGTRQGRLALPGFRLNTLKRFEPHIIHTQLFLGAGLEALLAAKVFHIPLIGTNHTSTSEFIRYSPLRSHFATNALLGYVSWYYNHCEFVTAPSRVVISEMRQYGFHKPGRSLSNPINTEKFRPAPPAQKRALKKEFGLSPHTVLFAGRLAAEKHIDVLLSAVAEVKQEVPDISLALTGHGAQEEELKMLAKRLGIEENVVFFGFVATEKLIKIYQASDVFAVASTAETQCLTMMNAMAVSLPVVGVAAYGLPEYIQENNGFLVPVGDVSAFVSKITLLFQDKALAARLSSGGHEFVQQFSIASVASSWEEIYETYAAPL